MGNQEVTVDLNPDQDALNFIENQLYAFNVATTQLPFGGFISCVIRDKQNAIIAGIHGYTWGIGCHIDYMWVDENQRGQGYGSKLLEIIEAEALNRGCKLMVTETFSFQALPFYLKANYEVTGKMEGFPESPHENFFLKKVLK